MILRRVNGDKIVQHIDKEQNRECSYRKMWAIAWPFLLHFQHPAKQHSFFVVSRSKIVLPMKSEWSIFRGIAVSLLRPVIGSNFEIEWCRQTNSCRIQMIVQIQQYLLKIRLSQSSPSSCIIGKHQYKWYVYTILLTAHLLYFSAHYFRSRPLFWFSYWSLVHRCP